MCIRAQVTSQKLSRSAGCTGSKLSRQAPPCPPTLLCHMWCKPPTISHHQGWLTVRDADHPSGQHLRGDATGMETSQHSCKSEFSPWSPNAPLLTSEDPALQSCVSVYTHCLDRLSSGHISGSENLILKKLVYFRISNISVQSFLYFLYPNISASIGIKLLQTAGLNYSPSPSVNTFCGLQNMHIFYAPHLADRCCCRRCVVWLKMFLFHF